MAQSNLLEEYLRDIRNPAPVSIDPEQDENDVTTAKVKYTTSKSDDVIDHEDVKFGSLRKRSEATYNDPKYAGKAVSRKDIGMTEESSDDDSEENYDNASEDNEENDSEDNDDEDDNDKLDVEGSHDELDSDEEIDNDDDNEEDADSAEEDDDPAFKAFSSAEVTKDIEKGQYVKKQLELWDKLLESRIHLQKLSSISNRLPKVEFHPQFKSAGGPNLANTWNKSKVCVLSIVNDLMGIQKQLLEVNAQTEDGKSLKNQSKNNGAASDDDEEIDSDTEDENSDKNDEDDDDEKLQKTQNNMKRKRYTNLEELSEEICKRHKSYAVQRDNIVSKWNEKTKFSSGKMNSKTFSSFDKPTIVQIKHVLNDKERLIKRTQLKRSSYHIIGSDLVNDTLENEDVTDSHLKATDPEIFDDDDFYHQLLKELIERKASSDAIDDPLTIGKQWLQLQRMRSKIKRKVDTKASKGRRVRYEIHAKLVNFMAPIEKSKMSDQARNDLFNSLFGRNPNAVEAFNQ